MEDIGNIIKKKVNQKFQAIIQENLLLSKNSPNVNKSQTNRSKQSKRNILHL